MRTSRHTKIAWGDADLYRVQKELINIKGSRIIGVVSKKDINCARIKLIVSLLLLTGVLSFLLYLFIIASGTLFMLLFISFIFFGSIVGMGIFYYHETIIPMQKGIGQPKYEVEYEISVPEPYVDYTPRSSSDSYSADKDSTDKAPVAGTSRAWRKQAAAYYWHKRFGRRRL